MKTLLTLLVTLISSCYIVYGAVVLVSKGVPDIVTLYGVVALIYGMLAFITAIGILISIRRVRTIFVNISGVIFLALFVAGTLDSSLLSGHEIWGLTMAAFPIVVNGVAMRKLLDFKAKG